MFYLENNYIIIKEPKSTYSYSMYCRTCTVATVEFNTKVNMKFATSMILKDDSGGFKILVS